MSKNLIPIRLFGPQHPGYTTFFRQGWGWMETANSSSCHGIHLGRIDRIVAADALVVATPGRQPLSFRFFGLYYTSDQISSKVEFDLGQDDFPAHEGPMPQGVSFPLQLAQKQKELVAAGYPYIYIGFQIWGNNPPGQDQVVSTIYGVGVDLYTES